MFTIIFTIKNQEEILNGCWLKTAQFVAITKQADVNKIGKETVPFTAKAAVKEATPLPTII